MCSWWQKKEAIKLIRLIIIVWNKNKNNKPSFYTHLSLGHSHLNSFSWTQGTKSICCKNSNHNTKNTATNNSPSITDSVSSIKRNLMTPYKIHMRRTTSWADQFETILKASKLQPLMRQPTPLKKKDWKNFSMKK